MIIVYFIFGEFYHITAFKVFSFETFIYYYTGIILGKNYDSWFSKYKAISKIKKYLISIYCLFVLSIFLINYLLYRTLPSGLILIKNILLIFMAFHIFDITNLVNHNFIQKSIKLSKYTFMIYMIHPFLLEIIEKIFFIVLPHNSFFALMDYIFAPIITISLIIIICILLKKVCPKLYRFINGNRKIAV